MKNAILLLFFFLTFSSFAQTLSGTRWMMTSIDNLETAKSTQITTSIKAYLVFESDSAYSGRFCNSYSGRVRTNAARQMKLTVPVATKLSCLGIDNYEKELFDLLPKVTKYRIEEGYLYLFTINRKRVTFKAEK
ncbi:MAG: META domain-containing protein [Bacteroidota bacterium]